MGSGISRGASLRSWRTARCSPWPRSPAARSRCPAPAAASSRGLPYTCDLETLNIEAGQPTLQGRQKVVNEVILRVKDTRGLSAGPTADRLVDIKERTTEQPGFPTTAGHRRRARPDRSELEHAGPRLRPPGQSSPGDRRSPSSPRSKLEPEPWR